MVFKTPNITTHPWAILRKKAQLHGFKDPDCRLAAAQKKAAQDLKLRDFGTKSQGDAGVAGADAKVAEAKLFSSQSLNAAFVNKCPRLPIFWLGASSQTLLPAACELVPGLVV